MKIRSVISTQVKKLIALALCLSIASQYSVALADVTPQPSAQSSSQIGNFIMTPELMNLLDKTPMNGIIEVVLNGDLYRARYLGKVCADGTCRYGADNVNLVARGSSSDGSASTPNSGRGSVTPGTPNAIDTSSKGSTPGSGPGASSGSGAGNRGSVVGDAIGTGIQAGVTHAIAQGIYRALIFTSSKEAELHEAKDHFERASNSLAKAQGELGAAVQGLARAVSEGFNGIREAVRTGVVEISFSAPEYAPGGTRPEWIGNSAEFKSRATPLWDKIQSANIPTRLEDEAHDIGLAAIRGAAEADLAGDREATESQLKIAETMADILFGLDPYTGFARDSWEFFTGKNIITGEPLPGWQRALSGVGMAASLATFGIASSVSNALKNSSRIIGHLNAAERVKALIAMSRAESLASRFVELGADSAAKLSAILKFSRDKLKNGIKSPETIVHFSSQWSEAARATFPKVARQLGLSADELTKEVARLGISAEVLQQRRLTAIGHYNSIEKFTGRAVHIADHLKGIDFSKPVQLGKVLEGEKLFQHKIPGEQLGNYFSRTVESPSRLGIGLKAELPNGNIVERELIEITVQEDITVLESVSSTIIDVWSIPNMPQATSGGATQLLIDTSLLKFK